MDTPNQHERFSALQFEKWVKGDEPRLACKTIYDRVELREEHGRPDFQLKSIKDCVFEDQVDLYLGKGEKLIFLGCTFKGMVEITIKDLQDSIIFNECNEIADLSIHFTNGGLIEIKKSNITNNLIFSSLIGSSINLDSIKIGQNLKINSFEYEYELKHVGIRDLHVVGTIEVESGGKIETLEISGTRNSTNRRYDLSKIAAPIDNFHIKGEAESRLSLMSLNLDSYNYAGRISLDNVNITRLTMNNVSSEKTSFRFYNSYISGWEMTNSAPKDLYALNLDLRNCRIIFDNTLLIGCVFSNIQWPKGKLLHSEERIGLDRYGKLKEVYRQLKHASLRDSNNIDALAFHSNEMKAYRASGIKGVNDWLLMQIGYLSNNYGQNFFWPIWWLLGIHLILFLIAIGMNYNGFHFTANHDWSAVWDFIGSYLYLLNPVHKLPTDETGGMLIVDFFMRLSSGFFIYHIIRASRKFSKL